MDRDASRPLSTEEAKARFRAAAEAATPTAWLTRHPVRAITLALVGGFVVARLRLPAAAGMMLAQKVVVPLLAGTVKRR